MAISPKDFTPERLEKERKERNIIGIAPALNFYVDKLKDLKTQLDEGKIEVAEYIQAGREIAKGADRGYLNAAGSGSRAASEANSVGLFDKLAELGFSNNPSAQSGTTERFSIDLGPEYEQRLREELIPKNVTGEERKLLLEEIPHDIGFDTDRFKIEREAIRQKISGKKTLEEQKTIQKSRLGELSELLARQEKQQFEQNIPDIAGTAQAQGFLETSGFGTALARERSRLASNTQTILGLQSLADRDFEVNAVGNIAKNLNEFRSSGLQRQFGLEDLSRSEALARELARLAVPSVTKARGNYGGIGTLVGAGVGALGAGLVTGGMGAGAGAEVGAAIGGGAGASFRK